MNEEEQFQTIKQAAVNFRESSGKIIAGTFGSHHLIQ